MNAAILRSAAASALLAAFPALATAQMSATSVSTLLELGKSGPSLSILPKAKATQNLVLGSFVDPSMVSLGSMQAQLFDQQGQVAYDLVATVSEYIAAGSSQRFGGISGSLYQGGAPTGIQVSGQWVIDSATGKGSFDLEIYLGGFSPTAPVLSLGSLHGVLGKPQSLSSGGGEELAPDSGGIPVASQRANFGSPSQFGAQSGGGGGQGGAGVMKLVVRDLHGRWTMI